MGVWPDIFAPGSAAVPAYRIYAIKKDGHISGPPEVIECADDREAVEKARQHLDGYDIEVWRGSEPVAYLRSAERRSRS